MGATGLCSRCPLGFGVIVTQVVRQRCLRIVFQKSSHTHGIGQPPGDGPLRIQPLEVPHKQASGSALRLGEVDSHFLYHVATKAGRL